MVDIPPRILPLPVTTQSVTPGSAASPSQTTTLPPALAVLAAGSILQGKVAGRDAQGNVLVQFFPGTEIALKTELPLRMGAEVSLRFEQVQGQTAARIVSVEGRPLAEWMQGLPQVSADTPEVILDISTGQAAKPAPGQPSTAPAPAQASAAPPADAEVEILPAPGLSLRNVQPGTVLRGQLQPQLPVEAQIASANIQSGLAPKPETANLVSRYTAFAPAPAAPPTTGGPQAPALSFRILQIALPNGQTLRYDSPAVPSAPSAPADASSAAGMMRGLATLFKTVMAPSANAPAPPSTSAPATPAASAPAAGGAAPATATPQAATAASPAGSAPALSAPASPAPAAPGMPSPAAPAPAASSPLPGAASPPPATPTPASPSSPVPGNAMEFVVPKPVSAAAPQVMLEGPKGALMLDTPLNLPPGTRITLLPLTGLPPEPPSHAAPPAQAGQGWSGLSGLIAPNRIPASDPALQALAERLPRPDEKLAVKLLPFLTPHVKGTADPLPELAQMLRAMETQHPAAQRAAQELSQLPQQQMRAEAPWMSFFVPIYDGHQVQEIRWYMKRREKREGEEDDPARFILELFLSHLGMLQMDGLFRVHDARRQFDLIIRSHAPLPAEMQQEISYLFSQAMEETNMQGAVQFAVTPEFPVKPAEENAASTQGAFYA